MTRKSKEFYETSIDELVDIISCDELNLADEAQLFKIIFKWIDYDARNRKCFLIKALKYVRLGFVSKNQFLENVLAYSPLLGDDEHKLYLNESIKFLNELALNTNKLMIELNNSRLRPRVPHEMLLVVGGWTNGMPSNAIELYDVRANLWHSFDALDRTPRAYHSCIHMDDYIYAIGGYDDTQYFNSCRRFDLLNKEWLEMAPMNCKRYFSLSFSSFFLTPFFSIDLINFLLHVDATLARHVSTASSMPWAASMAR